MKMKIIDEQQGSEEWKKLRLNYCCASDAAAMMGLDSRRSREDLIRQKATGIEPEVNEFILNLYASGHKAETEAREKINKALGINMVPVITVAEIGDIPMLASLDGIFKKSGAEPVVWEHKLYNKKLISNLSDDMVPDHIWPQLEHQMAVAGINTVTLCVSSPETGHPFEYAYNTRADRRQQLLNGWKQFLTDLKAYKPAPAPAGIEIIPILPMKLPAINIQLTGKVISTNLEQYKSIALTAFSRIKTDLQTDQDFGDAIETIKWLEEIESRVTAAQQYALSQTESIDRLFSTLNEIHDQARSHRLPLERAVKTQKEQRKIELIAEATKNLMDHIAWVNQSSLLMWAKVRTPDYMVAFRNAIYGKKSLETCRVAVDHALAALKIDVNNEFELLVDRVKQYKAITYSRDCGYDHLFPDIATLIFEDNFDSVIKERIADFETNVCKAPVIEVDCLQKKSDIATIIPANVSTSHPRLVVETTKIGFDFDLIEKHLDEEAYKPKTRSLIRAAITRWEIYRIKQLVR